MKSFDELREELLGVLEEMEKVAPVRIIDVDDSMWNYKIKDIVYNPDEDECVYIVSEMDEMR